MNSKLIRLHRMGSVSQSLRMDCTRYYASGIKSDSKITSPPLTIPPGTKILPAILLYRRILRAHRTVLGPQDQRMRALGDKYVRSEFRAHKDVQNPAQVVAFLGQWTLYLQRLTTSMDKLQTNGVESQDLSWIDKLSSEQMSQLYELMRAAKGIRENDQHKESSS